MATPAHVIDAVARATGRRPDRAVPLGGGCVGDVWKVESADGPPLVAKLDASGEPRLDIEGRMLEALCERSDLPVPRVVASSPSLLVMEFVEGGPGSASEAEAHAADLLAALHAVGPPAGRAGCFGFDEETLIGALPQPNPWTGSWLEFFRDQRLLGMAREAGRAGRLDGDTLRRVGRLAERLDRWIDDDASEPSLVHGDVWGGNVITRAGRVVAFIDPAVHYADAEVELAFIGLFSTFGERFYRRYHERRPIRDGFFEERRDLYNLYPLLVHARLFGGGYGASVRNTLRRFGV